jgi:hypothetical protein
MGCFLQKNREENSKRGRAIEICHLSASLKSLLVSSSVYVPALHQEFTQSVVDKFKSGCKIYRTYEWVMSWRPILICLYCVRIGSREAGRLESGDFQITFPHDGADLAYEEIPADVLLEASLESCSEHEEISFLPRDVLDDESVGNFAFILNFDKDDAVILDVSGARSIGHLPVKLMSDDHDYNSASRETVVKIRRLDEARAEAFVDFRAAEGGKGGGREVREEA